MAVTQRERASACLPIRREGSPRAPVPLWTLQISRTSEFQACLSFVFRHDVLGDCVSLSDSVNDRRVNQSQFFVLLPHARTSTVDLIHSTRFILHYLRVVGQDVPVVEQSKEKRGSFPILGVLPPLVFSLKGQYLSSIRRVYSVRVVSVSV